MQLKSKLDPNCISFLKGKGIDPVALLDGMVKFDSVGTAYIAPTFNSEGKITSVTNAVTPGIYVGQSTTLNLVGAFFQSSFAGGNITTDRGRMSGGTQPAQLFILLHELAHATGVLENDAHDQRAVDRNDKALEKNCKDAIKSFSQ